MGPALLGNAVAWGGFFYSYEKIKVRRGLQHYSRRASPLIRGNIVINHHRCAVLYSSALFIFENRLRSPTSVFFCCCQASDRILRGFAFVTSEESHLRCLSLYPDSVEDAIGWILVAWLDDPRAKIIFFYQPDTLSDSPRLVGLGGTNSSSRFSQAGVTVVHSTLIKLINACPFLFVAACAENCGHED